MNRDIYYLIKSFLADAQYSQETDYYDYMISDEYVEKWSKEYVRKLELLDDKPKIIE